MKRLLSGILMALVAVALCASAAQAGGKKKGKKAAKIPDSPAIAKSMSDLKWGMSKKQLVKALVGKVKDKYRPLVAKTQDAVEEDRLRQEAKDEMKAIRSSYVTFTGKSTGWDISFLKGEFTHGNDESMLVVRDQNSQNFYFFIGGRLWKWYKAFDAQVFDAGNFAEFASAVQRRFGQARDVRGEAVAGAGERHWLEWQNKDTRLRAIDQTDFYGFYCMVFEEKATVSSLARLRSNTIRKESGRHALVDSVTSGESYEDPDDSPNIVDRITGKLRVREQAPERGDSSGSSSSSKKRKKSSSSSSSSSSGSAVNSDDDPLRGLGL